MRRRGWLIKSTWTQRDLTTIVKTLRLTCLHQQPTFGFMTFSRTYLPYSLGFFMFIVILWFYLGVALTIFFYFTIHLVVNFKRRLYSIANATPIGHFGLYSHCCVVLRSVRNTNFWLRAPPRFQSLTSVFIWRTLDRYRKNYDRYL